jgi:RHS repeat-associated protein
MLLHLRNIARIARRNRRVIREGLRQAIALLLAFAMPTASLPIERVSLKYGKQTRLLLPLVSPDFFKTTLSGETFPYFTREVARPAATASNPPSSSPMNLKLAAPAPRPKVPPSGPTITFVQQAAVRGAPSGSNTLSLAFGSPSTSGNLIVVGVKWGDQTISVSSIVDNKGNTYTSAIGPTNWSGTSKRAQTFYAKDIVGGGSPITITVTLSATPNSSFYIYQLEYSGADLNSPVDLTSAAIGTSLSLTSGTVTTNYTNDLIFGFSVADSGTLSSGSGFTARSTLNGNLVEDETVGTPAPSSATATNNISSNWFIQMVAFRVGGNGGSAPTITSINPTSGAVGSSVTVTGTNFGTSQGNSLVTFNGQTASATSWSSTNIVAVVPTGATTGDLKVNVGGLLSNGKDFTVTAGGSNPPVANAGPAQTVPVTATVQLDGTASTDPRGNPLTYQWSLTSLPTGSSAALTNSTSPRPTFVADKAGNYTAQLVVNDGTLSSSPATAIISTTNSSPVANAGPAQTVPVSSTVHLDGRGSNDVDGDPLTYAWTIANKPSGSSASLSNATAVNPTFVADLAGNYTAQLVVSDGHTASAPSQTIISTTNSAPVANPGPNQYVPVGTPVQLDGSRSTDVDGNPLTYAWTLLSKPAGSSAVLSSPTPVNPTFVADANGAYVVQLIVNDGTVNSTPATVTIATDNIAPVANAGPDQTVAVAAFVTLDGSRSTAINSRLLSYRWAMLSRPSGSNAALSGSLSVNPSFTADVSGTFVIQLIVNDGFSNSAPSTVVISTVHSRPVANAGPNQNVAQSSSVTLNGSGSYSPDHSSLTYTWAILSQPTGASVTLSNLHIVNPTFAANTLGVYVAQLIVNDGTLNSFPSTVEINSLTPAAPIVSAGSNAEVELPNNYILQGSVSPGWAGGNPTSLWTQVSGPGTVTFANATNPTTTATFPVVGSFVLKLTGTDGNLSSSATVTIKVDPVNQAPIVNAGPDQTVTFPNGSVALNGTATDDTYPLGSTLQISWSAVVSAGPFNFSSPHSAVTQATFTIPGNYVFRLSASDGQYTSTSDVRVVYLGSQAGGIVVNAGPNQVVAYPNAATLNGSATDTNPPSGSTLSVQWSKVSGPGTATFSSPTATSSTVTFSLPGVYDLRLTATNGTFTSTSDVKIYSGNLQCTLSNKGTDFWLMFTGAEYQNPATPNGQPAQQLYLFISSDVATSVTVTAGPSGNYLFNQNYSTIPGQITPVYLPQSVQMISSDAVDANGNATDAKGIHVTSQNPVAVYGLNFYPYLSDGYLGLPTVTLGTSYVVASYQNTLAAGVPTFGTEFGITATQDNTDVTIVPTATSGTRNAQAPFTIHMKQGQTYQLRNSTDHTQLGAPNGPPVDYTGTLVTSTKPVAVFGAHDCTVIPDGSQYCNSLVEQLPPVNLWGQNFVTMPLGQELHGDTFRFVANTTNTHVQVNHQEVAVLQQGQFYEQIISGPAEITADNPILTVQYALSNLAGGGSNVDPTMIVVPPFEQFGGSYTINTPTSGWFPVNFVNIIAPTSAAQASAVVLDGVPVPAVAFQPIGTSPFSGAQINVTLGAHTLTSSLPFGLWVYGFKLTDAYGYTGGVCFSTAVSGSTLVASPKTTTNQITSQLSVQGTVKDASGNPISGMGVAFAVSGVNSQSGYSVTNLSGVATFTYTSLRTGSDLITMTAGAATDTAGVTWISNGPNQPPVVSAGPNQTISLPTNSVSLNGSVVDDGLPNPPATLTSSWSKMSGPGTVTFTTPSLPQTSATFSQVGTYVLQLTGSDSVLSTISSVTVTVLAANQPPVASAGPNRSFMWFQNQQILLDGSATTDDFKPNPPGALTYNWSTVSGPDLAVFSTPTANVSYATFNTPGNYVVQLSANDSLLTTNAYAAVTAYGPVNINVGPNLQTTVGTPITINGSVLVGGQPPTGAMPLKLSWGINSEPNGSSVTFGSPSSAVTTASFNTLGAYQLCLQASDANLQPVVSTKNCTLNVNVVATNPPVPTVSIATPLDGSQLTSPTDVIGSVTSGTWTLDYALQDDFHPMVFTTLATNTSVVSNNKLGSFDPTLLLNGTYVIRLTSVNTSGQFATASTTVSVARNLKVGVFSLSFNDLTVPVAGIPIQVIRSYDSRDKGQGDFGVGWRLSIANVRVQKNRNLSLNWQETQTNGQVPSFCLLATDYKVVTITFPDGRVFTFQPNFLISAPGPNQMCQQASQITSGTLTFTELPGPANTFGATLASADGGQFLVDGNSSGPVGPVTLTGYDGNPYNPTSFILKTTDGNSYAIDQKLGLTAVTDTNGNTLAISPNGITGSGGISVPFARDEQGRITRITDPNKNTLVYTYNPNGDLSGYTDRATNPSAYAYDGSHNLTGITGADGKQVLTNIFDPNSGRLTSTKDAKGFITTFSPPNFNNNTQVVTDRNGYPTTYVFDTDGNVTKVTDALGNVTQSFYNANDTMYQKIDANLKVWNYTYDNNGNLLSETDPLAGTDGLSHTTTYTYTPLNKIQTILDANNKLTTNNYDPNTGNLTSTVGPAPSNATTQYLYWPNGLLKSTTDALQNVTSFVYYPGTANIQTQTDAVGTQTTYTYDSNGNRLTETVQRTLPNGSKQNLITSYTYDGNDRRLQTTYPDNSTTQIHYNSLGQKDFSLDGKGFKTAYQYDADGHVTLTTFPDGTTESSTYDNNGNRKQFIDRTNITTTYTYDAINRLTQTQRGSNPTTATITSTGYTVLSQVKTTTDPNGNITQYSYDDAGRRKQVIQAFNTTLSQTTNFGYDPVGNQTSVQDANQHTTNYEYDELNRRTRVTYPDQKFEQTAYDAVGRVQSRTDGKGITTQYTYDGVGRLKTVTDNMPTQGVTKYDYDEVGNRIRQTDANVHATNYQYDQRGRRTQRTLPLGQSESYTYDANGNLTQRTDFNQRVTTYAYDNMNRLLSKTPDQFFIQNHIGAALVSYAYDQFGRRASMTDASGTTSYVGYDNNGHATQISKPAGNLLYSYDAASNLKSLAAQNTVNYYYDALERLGTVSESTTGNTTYGYDPVGNLQAVTYPNGVVHNYNNYNTRNQLTNLSVTKGGGTPTPIASYAYSPDAAGHLTGVTELSGRTVTYGYDNLYRLTSETIASDPGGQNGTIGYPVYDAVGNRKQITSTVPAIAPGLWNYDANDRLTAGDTYDANGNTVSSGGIGDVYDFENRLVQQGGIAIVYDGDGNRVSKTVAGVTTTYLVDDQNPTGYAQVVYETVSGSTALNREQSHTFVYGLEGISNYRQYIVNGQLATAKIYYVYDGHSSVRALTDTTGTVTDTYDYDAFGNLIHSTGATYNNYLFAGEQFDPDLHLYFNRARYLNTSTGRFWSMDSYEGTRLDPTSLHKYLYTGGNPVDRTDPSGNGSLDELLFAVAVSAVLLTMGCTQPEGVKQVNVFQIAYEREEGGLHIVLGASIKGRQPSYPEYNWVQKTTTNAILQKDKAYGVEPGVPFNDPPYQPFYYDAKWELKLHQNRFNSDIDFEDTPNRPLSLFKNVGTIYWRADLYLVGISPAGSTSYTPIRHITYGFTEAQNGEMTWDTLAIGYM